MVNNNSLNTHLELRVNVLLEKCIILLIFHFPNSNRATSHFQNYFLNFLWYFEYSKYILWKNSWTQRIRIYRKILKYLWYLLLRYLEKSGSENIGSREPKFSSFFPFRIFSFAPTLRETQTRLRAHCELSPFRFSRLLLGFFKSLFRSRWFFFFISWKFIIKNDSI